MIKVCLSYLMISSISGWLSQAVIHNTNQQITDCISKFYIIQYSFAELLVLRHTANYNIHKRIIERESEMFLRVIPSLGT